MRVLFDIVHPAHVHFYRHLRALLADEGHATFVVARDKDVTVDLLRAFSIPHVVVGQSGKRGLVGQGAELIARDAALLRYCRGFRPDLILTRSPAGVQVARLLRRTKGIFDTDDGKQVGIHYWASAPFAHVITTPDSMSEDYGRRHRRYRGYKALAYLHPRWFTPDPNVRRASGIPTDRPLFVIRFVAHVASHDRREHGLTLQDGERLVHRLARAGTVAVTSEASLPASLEPYRARVPPQQMHDLLAAADLVVGDSQTMAIEAGLLGTPSIRTSTFTGRLDALRELEEYGLVRNFRPDQTAAFFAAVEDVLADLEAARARSQVARHHMLADKQDVTMWYRELLDELLDGRLP